ncbi:MAG: hypothetical protein INR73_12340 [Williamsia sp.]|nr:hypothetical protein [Williamsia sp.]
MPKIVDYPLFSFSRVLELANTVDYLGGSCTIADCAHQLKKKVSGGFGVLVSSGIKHDLIQRKGDRLSVSELYKKIKFSYNPSEKIEAQRVSFLHPVLYRKIYDRFKGKELPLPMLDKLLIREFQVDEKVSAKIAGYFVEGLKRLQLLRDGKLLPADDMPALVAKDEPVQMSITPVAPEEQRPSPQISKNFTVASDNVLENNQLANDPTGRFKISIQGDGLSSTLVIATVEDLGIVEAMLEKIRKSLGGTKSK